MHPILKNTLALITGLLIGATCNWLLIMTSPLLIPPPAGADLTTPEGLSAAMAMMQPKHFLIPFLAHALGTLLGAFVTAKMAASFAKELALLIGLLFFIGGTYMVMTLSAPLWFNVTDLVLAYFPMALLGAKFSKARS